MLRLLPFPDILPAMDWAVATFFDRVIYGLWLDPDEVKAKFDLEHLRRSQCPQNNALMDQWRTVAPGSDATVLEFDFHAAGNAKRKLLRRLHGHVLPRRGGFRVRSSVSLEWLGDYTLAYEIVAQECGGKLLGWRYVPSPLTE